MAEELMNSSVDDIVDHVEAPLDQEQVPFVWALGVHKDTEGGVS